MWLTGNLTSRVSQGKQPINEEEKFAGQFSADCHRKQLQIKKLLKKL